MASLSSQARLVEWIETEYDEGAVIPAATLARYLRHEVGLPPRSAAVDVSKATAHAGGVGTSQDAQATCSDDEQMMDLPGSTRRLAYASPARRQSLGAMAVAADKTHPGVPPHMWYGGGGLGPMGA